MCKMGTLMLDQKRPSSTPLLPTPLDPLELNNKKYTTLKHLKKNPQKMYSCITRVSGLVSIYS